MKAKKRTREDYWEMAEALKPVGFSMNEACPGFFQHKLFGMREFDFTACSVEGAIKQLYLIGQLDGRRNLRNEINGLLKSDPLSARE